MITADTPAQLEALALTIAGVSAPDPNLDAQYLALIAPIMLAIEGRTMEPGFRYTLNFTNALQGRPKHWFLRVIESLSVLPANVELAYVPMAGVTAGCESDGYSIGLAACACILRAWAMIVRMWLAGNYPLAVNPAP